MSNDSFRVNSDFAKEQFLKFAADLYDKHKHVTFKWDTGQQRTQSQNRALHLWLGWVAEALNDAGLDMKTVLKQEAEIPWTAESAKEHLWRPIQQIMLAKESTVKADRQEYTQVYETLSRHLQGKLGIVVPPWPDRNQKKVEAA